MNDGSASADADRLIDSLLASAHRCILPVETAQRLGVLALQNRREPDALPALKAAARHARNDATSWQLLGLFHRALGDLAPAIAAFDTALKYRTNDSRLLHARAIAAAEAGLPALDWFARARALAPTDGAIILGEAAAILAEGDPAAADDRLAQTLRRHPGWLDGHDALARMRYAMARPDWLGALEIALARAPLDPRLHHIRIAALLRARDDASIRRATAAAPHVPELLPLRAAVATEIGELDEADDAFTRLDPVSSPFVLVHWLRHLLRKGHSEAVSAMQCRLNVTHRRDAWPYLSIAWRLTGDARARWLDETAPIGVVDLGLNERELNAIGQSLRPLHLSRRQPLEQSVRHGTQTDGPLLSRIDTPLQALRRRIDRAVRDYSTRLRPTRDGHPLTACIPRHPRLNGSWSVRLTQGGFHDPHVHPQGWLSSALYIALPPDSSGQEGWLTLGEPQPSLATGLDPIRTIEPRPGRLVLFPSILWHGTRPFPSGERLTVAFDIA